MEQQNNEEKRQVMPEQDIIKADARLRRRALWFGGIGCVAGLVAIGLLPIWLRHLDRDQAVWAVRGTTWLIAGAGALLALWLMRLATRIWRERRFPCHGMRVIRDTSVREGPAARRIAWVAIVGSVTSLALAAGLVFVAERMLSLLGP